VTKLIPTSTAGNPALLFLVGLTVFAAPGSQAQTFNVVYNFSGGTDGGVPLAGLTIDAAGNLYGTASAGGASGNGVVFKVNASGQQQVLYSFAGGSDGSSPQARLLRNSHGHLFGTTYDGGANGYGSVFEISTDGTERVLYNFVGGSDGANPIGGLTTDSNGTLYGTTFAGGTYSAGTVFSVSRGGKEKVLYSFGQGSDGASPIAGVTIGPSKNRILYGTTSAGGSAGSGTVFQLRPSAGGWQESILYNFQLQDDGGVPYSGLTFDHAGHIYGATTTGGAGGDNGGGTVFQMTHSTSGWALSTIYTIPGWGLSGSFRDLMMGPAGNIFATTHCDGDYGMGTIYELTPSGGTWNYNSLYVFPGSGANGYYVFSNLVADRHGNMYGTTSAGGAYGSGVVFEITP
jgi:uncharacterized repeat protein (TIGR03803 family)